MAKDKIQAGEITWRESRLRIMRSNATETFEKSWREKTRENTKGPLSDNGFLSSEIEYKRRIVLG